MKRTAFLLFALAVLSSGLPASDGDGRASSAREAGSGEPESLTVESCSGCHDEQIEQAAAGPHGLLDSTEWAEAHGVDYSCAACHGDSTAHMDEGGGEGNVFAFGDDELPSRKSEVCLDCHGDGHPRFQVSHHAQAGLACSDCHEIHGGSGTALLRQVEWPALEEDLDASSASCAECHDDILGQFAFNERHRLQEGILGCASCHDPHAPSERALLGGFKQEQCASCHTDKEGPFVFEHGAQRVEGCVACHSPHGAPNRHMLTFQSVAELCYSCHVAVPGFHLNFDVDTNCTNCHTTIHGSNFDPAFLK